VSHALLLLRAMQSQARPAKRARYEKGFAKVPANVRSRALRQTGDKSIKQAVFFSAINYSVSDQHIGYQFQLGQLTNGTSFTNIYDQYQITKVTVTLIPCYTNVSVATGAGNLISGSAPPPFSVIDYDDATPLTTQDAYAQFDTLKHGRLGIAHSRSFVPRIASAVYAGVGSTGYTTKSLQWIGTSSSVEHYGLKLCIPGVSNFFTGAPTTVQYKVLVHMRVKFRNTK
jgi:Circovirus capsid protein